MNKEIITYKQIIRILVKRGAGYWCRQDYYLKEVLLDALDIKEIEIPLIDGKKR